LYCTARQPDVKGILALTHSLHDLTDNRLKTYG
jgi:hypothetical protein